MDSIMMNHGVKRGVKLSAKNVGSAGAVESLPLYMAMFI